MKKYMIKGLLWQNQEDLKTIICNDLPGVYFVITSEEEGKATLLVRLVGETETLSIEDSVGIAMNMAKIRYINWLRNFIVEASNVGTFLHWAGDKDGSLSTSNAIMSAGIWPLNDEKTSWHAEFRKHHGNVTVTRNTQQEAIEFIERSYAELLNEME